jgi:hypothetical protein
MFLKTHLMDLIDKMTYLQLDEADDTTECAALLLVTHFVQLLKYRSDKSDCSWIILCSCHARIHEILRASVIQDVHLIQ